MDPQSFFTIISVLLAVAGGAVVLVAGTILAVKLGVGLFSAIGAVFGRIFEFIGGVFSDATRLVGAVLASIVFVPLVLLNVMLGRWSAANHFAEALRRELRLVTCRTVSIVARRPLRLLFLDGVLEGVEQRAVEAVRHAPGSDRPKRGMEFPGFEITGSLPAGGSGAKLYIARPDDATKRRLVGSPDEVVIKSFALAEGSSLPQIVRESRSLDAARRLGLVLAHELDDTRFWYAMPYHPGDNLSVVVRHVHAFADGDGPASDDLGRLVGYAVDLVATLDRYHREGMWHKDVKPDNIIVHDQAAHLVDFGLVSSLKSAMTLTTHGTEYFRDPEMVRLAMKGVKVHEVNGAKFDVYGAGAVLYFMLENTFPGHGGLSRFERSSPEALRMIVRRAMADYAHRYGSAAEMLADLRAVAAAADPWSVKPAMLPSMSGAVIEDQSDAEVVGVSRAATSRRPAPPPVATPPVAGRPLIPVTNWWTGAYASAAERPRAREQVRAARSRADARRRAVAAPGGGRLSGVLVVLVLGVISAVVGFLMVFSLDGSFDGGVIARGGVESEVGGRPDAWDFEQALAVGGAPATARESIAMVLDEQQFPADGSARSFAEPFMEALRSRGWSVVDDIDQDARARVLLGGRQEIPGRGVLENLGVDALFVVRTDSELGVDRVILSTTRGTGTSIVVVDVSAESDLESQSMVESEGNDRSIAGRTLGPIDGVVDRLERLADRLQTRFESKAGQVRIDWTSTPDAAIVMPHVVTEFVN